MTAASRILGIVLLALAGWNVFQLNVRAESQEVGLAQWLLYVGAPVAGSAIAWVIPALSGAIKLPTAKQKGPGVIAPVNVTEPAKFGNMQASVIQLMQATIESADVEMAEVSCEAFKLLVKKSVAPLMLALCLAGCLSPAPAPVVDGAKKPDVVQRTTGNHWSALADDVEAGLFHSSDELVGTVKLLHQSGKVDPAPFNAAFPEFVKRVSFTDANKTAVAGRLRALK